MKGPQRDRMEVCPRKLKGVVQREEMAWSGWSFGRGLPDASCVKLTEIGRDRGKALCCKKRKL